MQLRTKKDKVTKGQKDMRAISIYIQLEEIAEKIQYGVKKHGYNCVKTTIEEVNKLFTSSFTSNDPVLLLKATNGLVKLYNTLSNKNIKVDIELTAFQKSFLSSLKQLSGIIPLNVPVKYMGKTEPCFRAIINQLIEYFENDLNYNVYSLDYQKHFEQVKLLSKGFTNNKTL